MRTVSKNAAGNWLRDMIHYRAGEGLIWYLIRIEGSVPIQLFAWTAFFGLFWLGFGKNIIFALAMVLSMWLHECGHARVFSAYKIRWKLLMLFPLGAVAAPANKKENRRSDKIPWYGAAWLANSGVLVNLLLLFVGMALITYAKVDYLRNFGSALRLINTFLILMNILPIWKMDGKLLWTTVFSSLDEREDKLVGGVLAVISIATALLIVFLPGISRWQTYALQILNNSAWILIPMILAAGIWHDQGKDNPTYSSSPLAMSHLQSAVSIGTYVVILVLTLLVGVGPVKVF